VVTTLTWEDCFVSELFVVIDCVCLGGYNAPFPRIRAVSQSCGLFAPYRFQAIAKGLNDSGSYGFASLFGQESGQLIRFRITDVESHLSNTPESLLRG
jgi:hypothetical protein